MLIVGAVAGLIPLAFCSVCVWATIALPKRLHEGDTVFLNQFAFLFFRFRPGGHSYMVLLLLRNISLALVPIMDEPASELLVSCAVIAACVIVGVVLSPWAVHQANLLDLAMHTGLLFILLPCGTADTSGRRNCSRELASRRLLGNDVRLPVLTGLECPSLHAPTEEALPILLVPA